VLVFLGTLHQVEHGLYAAQKEFYYSWFALYKGFVPLPGGLLIMWVLFLNLFLSMMIHFQYGLRRMGSVLIHLGILLLLAGGWVTHLYGEESFLTLREGEASNVSTAYHDWELSAWNVENGAARDVTAVDTANLEAGQKISIAPLGLSIHVESYYPNAKAFLRDNQAEAPPHLNASGIAFLRPEKPDKNPQANLPGMVFTLVPGVGDPRKVLLYGGEMNATQIDAGGTPVALQLRRKRFPLPMTIRLIDFVKEFHPNSNIPKSFSSRIKVLLGDMERETLVRMTQPFRYRHLTFYQASYSDTGGGPEISTLAVTRNVGRLVPYAATAITVIGLTVHFLQELLLRPRKPLPPRP
jgi:hypothetical protein